ncbi:MAG: PASTA domain-containing protein [Acidimicrobiales bacterium]
MPTEPDRIQELVRQMNDTAENVEWDMEPEDIRARHRRRVFPAPDPKAIALVAAAVALIVVGFLVFRPAPHAVSTATTTTTTSGASKVTVPNVVGLAEAEAGEVLAKAELDVGAVSAVTSTRFSTGVVVSSDPGAGSELAAGASVALQVSSGPTTAPSTATPSTTTSTTTTGSALPTAPPCDTQPSGGSGIRPTTIFFGCATSNDYIGPISWSSWTSTTAIGSGTHNINDCQPDCAGGTYSKFPVDVQLSNPGYLDGVFVFRTIATTPTTGVGTPESATATGLYGIWGWPSS